MGRLHLFVLRAILNIDGAHVHSDACKAGSQCRPNNDEEPGSVHLSTANVHVAWADPYMQPREFAAVSTCDE